MDALRLRLFLLLFSQSVTLLRLQNAHRIQPSKFIFVDSGLSVVAGSAVMDTFPNDERLGE
jgi:hypothetical protein